MEDVSGKSGNRYQELVDCRLECFGRIPLNNLNPSNHRMLSTPAARQITRSTACSVEKRNISFKKGMYNTKPRKSSAPPTTHHSARFGASRVARIVLDHERLVRISPRLAMMRVPKVRARASISSCPR